MIESIDLVLFYASFERIFYKTWIHNEYRFELHTYRSFRETSHQDSTCMYRHDTFRNIPFKRDISFV